MDIRDYETGVGEDYFYFAGKRDLICVLLSNLGTGARTQILDIGAGIGDDLRVIQRFGEVHVIDIDPQALELIPDGAVASKRVGDACALPYGDDSFDLVVAFDTIEHIENDREAVREIFRVIRKGGYFVFTVPAFQSLYGSHDRALAHFRRYDKASLKSLLNSFHRVRLGYWMFLIFVPVALCKLRQRTQKETKVSLVPLPQWLNAFLTALLRLENRLIQKGLAFPFGTTIFGICQKKQD